MKETAFGGQKNAQTRLKSIKVFHRGVRNVVKYGYRLNHHSIHDTEPWQEKNTHSRTNEEERKVFARRVYIPQIKSPMMASSRASKDKIRSDMFPVSSILFSFCLVLSSTSYKQLTFSGYTPSFQPLKKSKILDNGVSSSMVNSKFNAVGQCTRERTPSATRGSQPRDH